MRKFSTLPCEIQTLNRDITDFQDNYRRLPDATCSADCYCRKQGNHKVTHSQYHKDCITMKKNINASVQKTDIVPPRRKCVERVNVFNLNKGRVEVSVKKSHKEKAEANVKSNVREQVVRFIDQGTDPIKILEPKLSEKQSWSDILTRNSKSNAYHSDKNGTKFKSTSAGSPKHYSSRSSSPVSCYKSQQKVVRDKGTQSLDEITKGDMIPVCLPRTPSDSISNPVISLQALVKELKDFKRRLTNQKDYNTVSSIISEMEIALNVLNQHEKLSLPNHCPNHKNCASYHPDSKEDARKSARNERLYKNLEETCTQLRIACQQLEDTCEKLRSEKDHVTQRFFEKSKEVESCLKRELEYQAKLSQASREASTMSLQLDQYSKSMEELAGHVRKLQEENRVLERAEEEKVHLHAQLMEASRENDKLNAELQLLTLEREKNRVLLDIKDKELDNLRKQLVTIGGLVSEKMKENAMGGDNLLYGSTRLDMNLSETRPEEVAFSSPDGSVTSPSKSWKAMSTITSFSRPQVMVAQVQQQSAAEPKKTHKGNTPPLESIKHLKNELRELFAQMKKQTEVSEALLLPDLKMASDSTVWSSITDSSDGYISITEADCSTPDT